MSEHDQQLETHSEPNLDELQERWQGKAKASSTTSSSDQPEPAITLCPRCGIEPANVIAIELQSSPKAAVEKSKPIPLPCDRCKFHLEEEARFRKGALRTEKEVEREKQLRENLEAIGVNVRKYFDQQDTTLGSFEPVPDYDAPVAAAQFLGDYKRGARPSLYLYSERDGEEIAPGNGKTHLAVAILRDLALCPDISPTSLKFVFVPELLIEIQDTFDNPDRSMQRVVNKYVKPELLVWDDFGAEKFSDFAVRTLYTILYKREGRSNIFTSNLSLDQIEERSSYACRITSRIAGDSRVIPLLGPDRRLMRKSA